MLGRLEPSEHPPEVLVSTDTADDASVYRLRDGTCLVQSVDFFTPIVDDAFDWGRVAAANAFSDLYAMGARPALALNLVGWPIDDLPTELLSEVLRGGAKVAGEAGAAVVGGHTIDDREPKYGMAVTGFVPEEKLVRNSTAPAGAALMLTKPLGTGIITTAIKRGKADTAMIERVVSVMADLNDRAAEAMSEAGVAAATDVTGFGLLGHLHGMLRASGVAAEVDASAVPILEGALALAEERVVPAGTRRNHDFLARWVDWGQMPAHEQLVLADAQTSGGLLLAVPEDGAEALLQALARRGLEGAVVGRTSSGDAGRITVRGRVG